MPREKGNQTFFMSRGYSDGFYGHSKCSEASHSGVHKEEKSYG